MPKKGKKAIEQEDTTSDDGENLSGDDEARPDAETLLNVTLTMPASEQGDLRPPASPDVAAAAFSTSTVPREERHFTPAFQSNISPSLQEQFDCALREERFGDLKGIKDVMRAAEHGGVQQQLALALKEKRWLEAAHFCEVISRSGDEQSDAISPPVQEQKPQHLVPEAGIFLSPRRCRPLLPPRYQSLSPPLPLPAALPRWFVPAGLEPPWPPP
jgi:hypothetical protein